MTEKITAADAIRLLDTGKAVAVDVREPDEYAPAAAAPTLCRSWKPLATPTCGTLAAF